MGGLGVSEAKGSAVINELLRLFAGNLDYTHRLVAELEPVQMTVQPVPGMNHPAWIIGHLAFNVDKVVGELMLNRGTEFPAPWGELFHGASKPVGDAAAYPGKDKLTRALDAAHRRITDLVREQPVSWLSEPATFSKRFATVGEALAWILVGHETLHLGQLSAWRRVMGMALV